VHCSKDIPAPIDAGAKNGPNTGFKYVFVCGLERSGTTVLASNLAKLENCTGFKHTGARKDEGQYLQTVYRSDPEFGGAGRYGFDRRAHLTEESDLLTPENVAKLRSSWHSHWEPGKSICVEKTPGNLIRTRFLQASFPNAYFIVIKRHPIAVSIATQKWSITPLHRLFEHWLRCYTIFDQDKRHLKKVYELTYEDYIDNPARHHQDIAGFIGTDAPPVEMEEVSDAHNQKYLDRWERLLSDSRWKHYYRFIAAKYDSSFAKYGYFLTEDFRSTEDKRQAHGETLFASGWLYCLAADLVMFPRRIIRTAQWWLERQLRARSPRPIKTIVKRLRA
jgi:hypothetical protein